MIQGNRQRCSLLANLFKLYVNHLEKSEKGVPVSASESHPANTTFNTILFYAHDQVILQEL